MLFLQGCCSILHHHRSISSNDPLNLLPSVTDKPLMHQHHTENTDIWRLIGLHPHVRSENYCVQNDDRIAMSQARPGWIMSKLLT